MSLFVLQLPDFYYFFQSGYSQFVYFLFVLTNVLINKTLNCVRQCWYCGRQLKTCITITTIKDCLSRTYSFKFFQRLSSTNFTWSILEYFVPFILKSFNLCVFSCNSPSNVSLNFLFKCRFEFSLKPC